jgi:Mg-chelatase subunit ChlD
MNPDSPIDPRSALESSLTALLLGELPHEQAAALHQKLAQDAELAKLYERLKHTINLVRETIATPAEQATAPLLPLRLEEQRRQKLLQHFKTVAPREFARPRRRAMPWLVAVGIAAGFVVILGGLFLPALSRSKGSGQSLAFRTWSLSKDAESAAPAQPMAPSAGNYLSLGDDGRTERLGLGKDHRRQSAVVTASAGETPRPAVSASTAIVLPKGGQADEANMTARVRYGLQPESAAAAGTRGFYDDSSGRSGGAGGVRSFGVFAAGKDSTPGAALALTPSAPADGVEAAKVPLQMHDTDKAAGDLFAGTQVHAAGSQPTEALGRGDIPRQPDVAWSDTSKQVLDAPAFEGRPKVAGGVKAAKEPEPRITLQGLTTLNKPSSPGPDLGFALKPSEPAPAFKGIPKDVALKPAESLAQAAPAPPLETPTFGVGEGMLVKSSAGARAWTRSFTVGNDPEGAGVPMQTQEQFAPAGAARAGRAAAPVATTDFSAINGDAQNLSYQWHLDASTPHGVANSDGEKAPILSDVPAAGRFYRLEGKSAGDSVKAQIESSTTPQITTWGGVESGVYVTTNMYAPAQAPTIAPSSTTISGYADQSGAWSWGTGNANVGTLTLGEDRPKSVELADEGLERQKSAANAKRDSYLGVTSISGRAGTKEALRGDRFGIMLPQPETSLTLKNGSAKGVQLYAAAKPVDAALAGPQDRRKPGTAETARTQPYFEAKRSLEELQRFRQILDAKIASEKTDATLPKTMMVEIADKAVPASSPSSSLWDKIRGKTGDFKSTARVKVERDQVDIAGLADVRQVAGYDPYFVQTEFETIQSEAVLGKVIKELNLNEAWGKAQGGRTLTTEETMALLKKNLDLRPEKNTSLINVGVKSDKPEEAAKIANAVAEAYKQHRSEQRAQLSKAGTKALEERYAQQTAKVIEAQKKVDDLRDKLNISDAMAAGEGAKKESDEKLPVEVLDFRQAKLDHVLDLYGRLANRTILRPVNSPAPAITLSTTTPLTKQEAIQALDSVLALNGITMINQGDNYVKAMPEAQGNTAGAPFDTNSAAHLPEMGQYTTHVVQLKYAKPSELVGAIQPLAGISNSILPIDSSQILVFRDTPENVERMSELVAKVDVAAPAEYVSEVIPIKHGKASDIANALNSLSSKGGDKDDSAPKVAPKPAAPAPVPQPEVQTADNAYSTFSLNVSDVAFKLAAASLEKGVMPEPGTMRSEEFINAFDYRDPEPPPGVPVAFAWERAQYPFAQNRDLLRFSIKTAALGRQPGRPLNLVLLLDNSGSMERADRVRIIREALRALAGQLQPQDKFSVVTFSRTPRLFADGAPGSDAEAVAMALTELTPQGGTNLEDAMNLAYQTALRHYLANGVNRVVLLTDGAANLGNVDPEALKQKVEANRKQGIALDCFGIGWEGYNDDLLEVLSRNGDGRYGFVNTPEEAATEFASQLAGALHVAASDVKVQVEFNLSRVTAYRQIGYAKHQLTKQQFRDNTVDAAEIAAAESGNALYVIEVNPRSDGPLGTVRVRYKVPGTSDYHEHEWTVPYTGNAVALEQASPAMRLSATASALSEWLVSSPYAAEVTPDRLLGYLSGVPEVYGADARPKKLEWMIRQAKSIAGK